ncbi:MAG: hypothetical protein CMJ89_10040 [Planctomycetes bacterium]|jgi:hypothetical protein|nr:hypothetical protein [Planctomycetota bacterium]
MENKRPLAHYLSCWLWTAAVSSAATLSGFAQNPEPGFETLFDGNSLTGWRTAGGRYEGTAEWSVVEGCIVGREGPDGASGYLYTNRNYTSFDLRFEVFLEYPFDSGVFCRMTPRDQGDKKGAQITLDYRPNGQIGAVYSDGYLQENETGKAHYKRGEWNDLRVRCTGFDMHLEFWLNGEKLTDYTVTENFKAYAPTGLIGLQVHGGGEPGKTVKFRNIRIRELPVFAEEILHVRSEAPLSKLLRVTEAGKAGGWKPLFNSRDLSGWKIAGESDRYFVQEGILGFQAKGSGGHIYTEEDFTNFRLRLDYRTSKMANSGIFLRASRDGSNPAFSGCEIQILDDFNWETVTGSTLRPYQLTGGLYGSIPSGDHKALLPIGEWNTYEILYEGSRIAVALNGRTLYDVDTNLIVPFEGEPYDRRARTGFIGLQHHGAHNIDAETMIQFRNVFVQPLP